MPAVTDRALVLLAPCAFLLGSVLQILLARVCSARAKGMIAFLTSLPAVAAVAATIPRVQDGQAIELNLLQWNGAQALVLHVDALSVLFALMGALLGAIVLLYSVGYMAHDKSATRFYATMQIFIGGFIALVYSANLLLMYLCWETIGLCSFSLVGFWYSNREAVDGARKVLLMTHIAGYGLLAAILVIYYRAGTALWTDPRVAHSFTTGVFLLMLTALIAKSVQVPLHTWIPEAMAAPTPVSSLLHAACYVTAGVYLAARMHSFGVWPEAWGATLIWVGTVTMAVGVMYAMVQSDLKRMLAYSTVSQIGYMMVGLGIGTPLAITAGLLHCLNHGFFKGGLFLNSGAVLHATGSRDMNELGGLAQRMPRTALCWLVGVGNMAGIPLMSGFVSKWMLYAAALQAGWVVPAMVAWVVSLGTVFLCVKATSAVFLGPLTEKTREAHEAPLTMQWAMGMMAAGSIVLGIAPQLAVNYLLNPILVALSLGSAMQVTWLGLFAGAGTFSTMGGLVLALVSLLLGGAIYALAYGGQRVAVQTVPAGGAAMAGAGGGIFTGGEPLNGQGRLTARDFSMIFEQNWKPFFRWSNVDRVYVAMWHGLEAASHWLSEAVAWMELRATVLIVAMAAVLLVGIRWLAPSISPVEAVPAARVPLLLVAACAVAACALAIAAFSQAGCRRLAPLMVLVGVAAVMALAVSDAWLRFFLLEGAALLTIPLVWESAKTRSAKVAYFAVVAISALCLLGSEMLMEIGISAWARALLVTSVCIKLAAVPFFFWLLRLADELPAVVLGMIVAVVDIAALAELYVMAQAAPALFTPQGMWVVAAAATSLIASLLMLAQRNLKRLLVLSTVEDVGFLLLGLTSASALGSSGVLYATASHALAKALLFACLSGPEEGGALERAHTGLAIRYPVSAFGFVFGMLAMLGVPPTLGYIGRWRLYETALQISPLLLAAFIVSSAFALIAYAMTLARVWWGPAHEPNSGLPGPILLNRRLVNPPIAEPRVLQATIVALVVLILLAGVWPDAVLQMLHGGRP